MSLEKEKFRSYKTQEERSLDKRKVYPISLNDEEQDLLLNQCRSILKQEKDSTLIKQLAKIGAKYIHRVETKELLTIVQSNERKNKRLGINYFE